MNWKELKEFSNSLNEKQLEQKVVLWQEERAISDIDSSILQADYYIGQDDEGCYTLEDAGITKEQAEELDLKIVYKAGTPILSENF